jgi:hypothetical protein
VAFKEVVTEKSVFYYSDSYKEDPIFGENSIRIKIEDENGGPFIVLEQDDNEVRMDEDEIQLICDIALNMLKDYKEKTGE